MVRLLIYVWISLAILSTACAREVRITIIHTTDLAGHILPIENAKGLRQGGLLAAASVIERIRSRAVNPILVDCGNLVIGSLESRVTDGAIVMEAINGLDYDAWVPGIHDWDWGVKGFNRFSKISRAPVLAANITVRAGRKNEKSRITPFIIKEIDGVRVAIVGLTAPTVPLWHRPDQLGDYLFLDSIKGLHKVLPLIRLEHPDLMILITNQGLLPFDDQGNQIREIMGLFREFDVVLGGQTGQIIQERLLDGRIYSQAGSKGHAVGRVDLLYDTVSRKITSQNAYVLEVSEREQPLTELGKHLEKQIKVAFVQDGKQIGSVDQRLLGWRKSAGQTALQRLLCKAIAAHARTDVAFHAMMTKSPLYEGPVRYKDLWRIIPYDSQITVLSLTVDQLDTILEENARYMKKIYFMGVHGLRYDLDVNARVGFRISNIRMMNGQSIHPKKRIRVAFDGLLLSSVGGRYPELRKISQEPVVGLTADKYTVREAVAKFFQQNSPIKASMYEAKKETK